jgi:hypothetical protein
MPFLSEVSIRLNIVALFFSLLAVFQNEGAFRLLSLLKNDTIFEKLFKISEAMAF